MAHRKLEEITMTYKKLSLKITAAEVDRRLHPSPSRTAVHR
jgi:hypothetical protein